MAAGRLSIFPSESTVWVDSPLLSGPTPRSSNVLLKALLFLNSC